MRAQGSSTAPIIIKKVRKGGRDAHHGGAWKVAYADFVTAMMAFFMLMWLLNTTTESQRSGIADYFSPTIAVARVSGGGDGAFGGDSVFIEERLAQDGEGATLLHPTEAHMARGTDGEEDRAEEDAALQQIADALHGKGGESLLEENQLKHIVTRVTDEGLVIELFDLEGEPLFHAETATPTPLLRDLTRVIHDVSKAVTNGVAVEAHVAAEPVVFAQSAIWDRSAARADTTRRLLLGAGMPDGRVQRVTGHADREPAVSDPMHARNNRLEVILLRKSRS
jgi:chemotaxis protein MotB